MRILFCWTRRRCLGGALVVVPSCMLMSVLEDAYQLMIRSWDPNVNHVIYTSRRETEAVFMKRPNVKGDPEVDVLEVLLDFLPVLDEQ